MIRTKKIKSISSKIPKDTPTEVYVNVLTWHQKNHKYGSEYYSLSPYFLKTDGNEENYNEGEVIFENYWQGSKVWSKVHDIDVWAHYSLKRKPQHLWWQYKCKNNQASEYHLLDEEIQNEYYFWRNELFNSKYPVRFPNGNRRNEVNFSLLIDKNGLETRLNYIEARKKLYFREYCRLIEILPEFQKLLKLYSEGKTIIICEIDVPDNEDMNLEKLKILINNPDIKFGHGLCLAWKILDSFI